MSQAVRFYSQSACIERLTHGVLRSKWFTDFSFLFKWLLINRGVSLKLLSAVSYSRIMAPLSFVRARVTSWKGATRFSITPITSLFCLIHLYVFRFFRTASLIWWLANNILLGACFCFYVLFIRVFLFWWDSEQQAMPVSSSCLCTCHFLPLSLTPRFWLALWFSCVIFSPSVLPAGVSCYHFSFL